jgi:hypothetical protein
LTVAPPPFVLSSLPRPFRGGLACLVLVLLYGLGVSAAHLFLHHENRDSRPGLTLDDLTGVYHGLSAQAPLLRSLERGHPAGLPAADAEALRRWLALPDLAQGYDDTKLGDRAPAEILDRQCLRCHARGATDGDGIGKRIPLEYWDDVKAQAEGRAVEPNAAGIVVASAHTHALAMGSLSVAVVLLAFCTRWPRRLTGLLAAVSGLALLVDLLCWLPARGAAGLVPVLAAAGAAWLASTAVLLLLVLGELVLRDRGLGEVARKRSAVD